jgi:hypothetical protein
VISLQPIRDLLKAKPHGFGHPWFRQVGGGGTFAKIMADALPLPAVWVVPAADKSRHVGERAEDVTLGFDVVIAIENAREHYPGETDDVLVKYRQAVNALLLGWQVSPDVKPLKFGGGQIVEYTEADIYWRDRYIFDALITNYLPDPPAYGNLKFTGEQL